MSTARRNIYWAATRHEKPPPSLTVSFSEESASLSARPEIVGALSGEYDLTGENHGKPVYKRRRRTAADEDVCVYYWDDIDDVGTDCAGDPGSWWFGCRLGENKVWAWSPSTSSMPPERGWEFGGGIHGTVELVITLHMPARRTELPDSSRAAPKSFVRRPEITSRGPAELARHPHEAVRPRARSYALSPPPPMREREVRGGPRDGWGRRVMSLSRSPPPVRDSRGVLRDSLGRRLPSPAPAQRTSLRDTRASLRAELRPSLRDNPDGRGEARLLLEGFGGLGSRPRFMNNGTRQRERVASFSRSLSRSSRRRSISRSPRRRPVLLPPRAHLTCARDSTRERDMDEEFHAPRQRQERHEPSFEPSAGWKNKWDGGKGGGGSSWYGGYAQKEGWHQGNKWFSSRGWSDDGNRNRHDELDGDLRIELGRRQLGDEGVLEWISKDGSEVLKHLGDGGSFDSVDLSENQLTDEGGEALIRWLLECKVPVRRLKLFKNRMRSPAALCGLIEDEILGVGASAGVRELHLSSNEIDKEGVIALLDSICERKKKTSAVFDPPLWLRLERCEHHLSEERAQKVVEDFAAKGLKICLEGGVKGSGCSIQHCKHSADVHLHVVGGNKTTGNRW